MLGRNAGGSRLGYALNLLQDQLERIGGRGRLASGLDRSEGKVSFGEEFVLASTSCAYSRLTGRSAASAHKFQTQSSISSVFSTAASAGT